MIKLMQKGCHQFICVSIAYIKTLLSNTALAIVFVIFLLKPQVGLSGEDMAYFNDPVKAVELIKTMLREEDWVKLSRYYDLNGTDDLDRAALTSGDFFIRKERPEVAHPGGFWKYKHPFAPQFDYLSHKSLSAEVVEVTVHIEIDQGGGMIQRGLQSFHLQKSANGYQLLPKSPDLKGAPDIVPEVIQQSTPNMKKPDWEK